MRAHHFATVTAAALAVALYGTPSQAQQRGGQQQREQHGAPPRANGGHIPPPPAARIDRAAPREPQRLPNGRIVATQHVDGDHWYGHDARNDARFTIKTPWVHGRFDRVGPSYRYEVQRFDARSHRFWIAGSGGFEVASWDWGLASDWCWTCGGDDFVVYDDPDHEGWYLVYNIHTGVYVHAQYIGQ